MKSLPKRGKVPGDLDLDGIPGPLDIDDDGDTVLDNFESTGQALLARSANRALGSVDQLYNPFGLYSVFGVQLTEAQNANASGLSVQNIDTSLREDSHLSFDISDFQGGLVELDCTGLSYCSPGGTGEVWCAPTPCTPQPFPECCDPDADGFGTLATEDGFFRLLHRAATDQIGTGDVLTARVTSGGVESAFPTTLQTVFATVPGLVSYSDTAGNSASPTYPVQQGDPGSSGNGFPVAPGPGGDVVLTFTFWRPQREPIPGEGGDLQWVDIGGLSYYTGYSFMWTPQGAPVCPASAYSSTDPSLTPGEDVTVGGFRGGFRDLAPDGPASPANTFTYSVNITQCLASVGETWSPGQERSIIFYTRDTFYDDTRLTVYFERR